MKKQLHNNQILHQHLCQHDSPMKNLHTAETWIQFSDNGTMARVNEEMTIAFCCRGALNYGFIEDQDDHATLGSVAGPVIQANGRLKPTKILD